MHGQVKRQFGGSESNTLCHAVATRPPDYRLQQSDLPVPLRPLTVMTDSREILDLGARDALVIVNCNVFKSIQSPLRLSQSQMNIRSVSTTLGKPNRPPGC